MRIEDILRTKASEFAEAILTMIKGKTLSELFDGDGVSSSTILKNVQVNGFVHLGAAPNSFTLDGKSSDRPAPAKTKATGRLPRRSAEEIERKVEYVSALLKVKGDLRSEQIRAALDLLPKEMPRILKAGIESGAFRIKSGEKRATLYGIGGASKTVKKTKPAAKRAKAPTKKVPAKTKKRSKKS